MPGFRTLLSIVPALNIGLFISSNSRQYGSFEYIMGYIIDIMSDKEPKTNLEKTCEVMKNITSSVSPHVIPPKQDLTHKHEAYVGTYGNDAYGDLKIETVNQSLTMKYGNVTGVHILRHIGNNAFIGIGSTVAIRVNGPVPVQFSELNNQKMTKFTLAYSIEFIRDHKAPDLSTPPSDAPKSNVPMQCEENPTNGSFKQLTHIYVIHVIVCAFILLV